MKALLFSQLILTPCKFAKVIQVYSDGRKKTLVDTTTNVKLDELGDVFYHYLSNGSILMVKISDSKVAVLINQGNGQGFDLVDTEMSFTPGTVVQVLKRESFYNFLVEKN